MYCKECGKEIGENSKFCSKCGKNIQDESGKKSTEEEISKKSPSENQTKVGTAKSSAKKILVIVLSIIAFIIAYAFVKGFIAGISSPLTNDNLNSQLQAAARELNKNAPQKMDEVTELTMTTVIGEDITYNYVLKTDENLRQSDLDNKLKSTLINKVCTTQQTKELLDMGAGMIYSYSNDKGAYIGKIEVHKADCR